MSVHSELMQGLKLRHQAIVDHLRGKRFHYIDIPIHDNIGDLLIMQGTLKFFKDHDLRPQTICESYHFELKWVKPGDIVVFHGGGNFGDLYSNIHALREKIVAALPDNKIILMPQTLFFSSLEARKRSAAIFINHRDLHLFTRDTVSHTLGFEFTPNVYLTPDMAHHLYPLRALPNRNASGTLRIQRVDDEKPSVPASLRSMNFNHSTDWVDVIGAEKFLIKMMGIMEWRARRYGLKILTKKYLAKFFWIPVAQRFSNKAIELFSNYENVVTDRLHGHILSCLMDKPNIVIDNSYGKNGTYMAEWTGKSPLTRLVTE